MSFDKTGYEVRAAGSGFITLQMRGIAMRDTIQTVTATDLRDLGGEWGINIGESEADALADQVNNRLTDDLAAVYDVPPPESKRESDGFGPGRSDSGERTWSEGNDEHNAIRVSCHVPPSPDHDGTLDGVTVGVKDLIAVAGVPMQCGSSVMEGHVPASDATVVQRLLDAGVTVTAKTTMDEFAGGGRGRTVRGLVRNPRDSGRIAGGSSGGSGAAVAADLVDVSLGTDTGGSTRKPAAFCGVVGLKPTYGLVPLTGVVENTYTLDHVGQIGDSVSDVAAVLDAIAGADEADLASMQATGEAAQRATEGSFRVDTAGNPGGYVESVSDAPPLSEFRIGVATQGLTDDMNSTVADRHAAGVDALVDAGATTVDVELPYLDATKHVKNLISYTELAGFWRDRGAPIRRGGRVHPGDRLSFARRADTATCELNNFYRSRILAGAQLVSAHDARHYVRAQAARATIRDELADRLADVDVIVTPTVPALAPTIERVRSPDFDYDGLDSAFGYGRYTKIANVTGVPAITVSNEVEPGPAVGMQLLGSRFDDRTLLSAARRVAETLLNDPMK